MTKEELKEFATIEDNTIRFRMAVDFNDLKYNDKGIAFLNELVDDFVDDGHKLMDLSYSLDGVDGDNLFILVEADCSEFWEDE